MNGVTPFNLMKSEQLIWVSRDVDYLETVARRERRGTSHSVSIRVAHGLYYRPGALRSSPVKWEEIVESRHRSARVHEQPHLHLRPREEE